MWKIVRKNGVDWEDDFFSISLFLLFLRFDLLFSLVLFVLLCFCSFSLIVLMLLFLLILFCFFCIFILLFFVFDFLAWFFEFLWRYMVTLISKLSLCNVLCLYHFAVIWAYCDEKLYAFLRKKKFEQKKSSILGAWHGTEYTSS